MERSAMRSLIRKELGETTAAFWSNDELNAWINIAGHDVAYKSKCIRSSGFMTTVLDQREYTMVNYFSLFLTPVRIYFYQDGNSWQKLISTDMDELDTLTPGWRIAESSTPTHYYFDEKRSKTIGLYPEPNSNNTESDGMEVIYSKDYTDMVLDANSPTGIPDILQLAMISHVVSVGQKTRGSLQKATASMDEYRKSILSYLAISKNDEYDDSDIVMKPIRNV